MDDLLAILQKINDAHTNIGHPTLLKILSHDYSIKNTKDFDEISKQTGIDVKLIVSVYNLLINHIFRVNKYDVLLMDYCFSNGMNKQQVVEVLVSSNITHLVIILNTFRCPDSMIDNIVYFKRLSAIYNVLKNY